MAPRHPPTPFPLASRTAADPSWSDPETWSVALLYLFTIIGVVVVIVCLGVFLYELSDLHRTARFVATNREWEIEEGGLVVLGEEG